MSPGEEGQQKHDGRGQTVRVGPQGGTPLLSLALQLASPVAVAVRRTVSTWQRALLSVSESDSNHSSEPLPAKTVWDSWP